MQSWTTWYIQSIIIDIKDETYNSAWEDQVRLSVATDDKTESQGELGNLEKDRDFKHEEKQERELQIV